MSPKRIQRSRAKGARLPEGAVYVGRPTKFGNPFQVGEHHRLIGRPVRDRAEAVELYTLHTGPMGNYELDVEEVRRELGGHDLACWCPLMDADGKPVPCHADVLLAVANDIGEPR